MPDVAFVPTTKEPSHGDILASPLGLIQTLGWSNTPFAGFSFGGKLYTNSGDLGFPHVLEFLTPV